MDLLLKDLLMVAFRRGPKTLQRWFRAGVVPNAYRTKGGVARSGNYRIKAPAGTRRADIVLWKKLLLSERKLPGLKDTKSLMLFTVKVHDIGLPKNFVSWCLRASDQVEYYMASHRPGRRWQLASPSSRRRRSTRQKPNALGFSNPQRVADFGPRVSG